MRRLLIAALMPLLGAGAPAMAQEHPVLVPAPGWGTAHIVLAGDYRGKQIRLSRNGRVIMDRRFTSPPGSEDRVPLFTDTFAWWVQVEIEGCPTAVEVRVPVEPEKSTSLIFDGCSVRALLPV
ncbi:hypothetical protein [Brevundimonas sp. UBA2416]|uniref:hypothetical protein n=1 Tax=Brevundimonas sp. UBA2416 TaxID=1946124 RepID=UPI0025BA9886|nr:hypothetical protein [Brevundimonas sp. UBA2416]HRJ63778.1 hypothetical protein [Brevundimonas sp.]